MRLNLSPLQALVSLVILSLQPKALHNYCIVCSLAAPLETSLSRKRKSTTSQSTSTISEFSDIEFTP
jgi:hypothetical protein